MVFGWTLSISHFMSPMCAVVCGMMVGRWAYAPLGQADSGFYSMLGGMMVVALLAFTMREVRGGDAAEGTMHAPLDTALRKF